MIDSETDRESVIEMSGEGVGYRAMSHGPVIHGGASRDTD